jgi:2Fe-2S ferredoxin
MEVIRDWGLSIKAECAAPAPAPPAMCGSARIGWRNSPPSSEDSVLDGAFNVDERSRLCCQIIMSKELDGLEVELAPESLADAPAERVAVGG